jgi:hypothetical protein
VVVAALVRQGNVSLFAEVDASDVPNYPAGQRSDYEYGYVAFILKYKKPRAVPGDLKPVSVHTPTERLSFDFELKATGSRLLTTSSSSPAKGGGVGGGGNSRIVPRSLGCDDWKYSTAYIKLVYRFSRLITR